MRRIINPRNVQIDPEIRNMKSKNAYSHYSFGEAEGRIRATWEHREGYITRPFDDLSDSRG